VTTQLIPADLLARTQIITGLRQLADYLDANPDIPVNEYGWTLMTFARRDDDTAGRAEVDQVAKGLTVPVSDDTGGGHYTAARTFGRITYEFIHVTQRSRAEHRALMSYADSVTPDDLAGADSSEAA
jgi:hypothetical protein